MFIEVQQITTTGKGTMNEKELVQLESINISDIKAFRHWHVGKNKKAPDYERTILIMNSSVKKEDDFESQFIDKSPQKVSTILIKEKYESFRDRLSYTVPVNKISEAN